MAPPHCEIHFDNNPQGVFHGGQIMSGSVELRLDKPKLVNDFRLVISGRADVRWVQQKGRDRKTYIGEEELLRAETKLIPQSNTEIPAGIHTYNFASPIPLHVPTSFEGEHGKIRYTVRAILDRPWKLDQACTAQFTVLKSLNLNHRIDTLKVRKKETLVKTFYFWPCTSSPLRIEAEIPMSGYVPGQRIPITVMLQNASSTSVTSINSSLQRKVSYISQRPRELIRVVGKSLASVVTTVTHDESNTYYQQLEIPSIAPTGKCSVLAIEYILKVKVHVNGLHSNPKIKFPITIGTIPFTSSPARIIAPTSLSGGCTDEIDTLPTAPQLQRSVNTNEDSPPPCYEEAMTGVTINANDDESNAIGFQVSKFESGKHK
ncbi:arrestin domain-containing protein 3-like isoform X2 [Armigeres subalbatus]|uniref:arrestin domain-containing protein 3-like isoform X2 n=1 Tax=Armigeres subalbatus TaxID=124917 RepID=UPI002ED4F1C4